MRTLYFNVTIGGFMFSSPIIPWVIILSKEITISIEFLVLTNNDKFWMPAKSKIQKSKKIFQ